MKKLIKGKELFYVKQDKIIFNRTYDTMIKNDTILILFAKKLIKYLNNLKWYDIVKILSAISYKDFLISDLYKWFHIYKYLINFELILKKFNLLNNIYSKFFKLVLNKSDIFKLLNEWIAIFKIKKKFKLINKKYKSKVFESTKKKYFLPIHSVIKKFLKQLTFLDGFFFNTLNIEIQFLNEINVTVWNECFKWWKPRRPWFKVKRVIYFKFIHNEMYKNDILLTGWVNSQWRKHHDLWDFKLRYSNLRWKPIALLFPVKTPKYQIFLNFCLMPLFFWLIYFFNLFLLLYLRTLFSIWSRFFYIEFKNVLNLFCFKLNTIDLDWYRFFIGFLSIEDLQHYTSLLSSMKQLYSYRQINNLSTWHSGIKYDLLHTCIPVKFKFKRKRIYRRRLKICYWIFNFNRNAHYYWMRGFAGWRKGGFTGWRKDAWRYRKSFIKQIDRVRCNIWKKRRVYLMTKRFLKFKRKTWLNSINLLNSFKLKGRRLKKSKRIKFFMNKKLLVNKKYYYLHSNSRSKLFYSENKILKQNILSSISPIRKRSLWKKALTY